MINKNTRPYIIQSRIKLFYLHLKHLSDLLYLSCNLLWLQFVLPYLLLHLNLHPQTIDPCELASVARFSSRGLTGRGKKGKNSVQGAISVIKRLSAFPLFLQIYPELILCLKWSLWAQIYDSVVQVCHDFRAQSKTACFYLIFTIFMMGYYVQLVSAPITQTLRNTDYDANLKFSQ